MNSRLFIKLAAISGFLATCLGAFGAHALKSKLSFDMLTVYQTGVCYQFYHSLALLLLGLLMIHYNNNFFKLSGIMFVLGILFFSGSLYLLAITGIMQLGIITPIGGVAFLIGWLMMALGINYDQKVVLGDDLMSTKTIRPEDILADNENFVELNGVTVRKGSIAAFLKNIDYFEDINSTDAQKAASLEVIKELVPAIIASGLHRHATFNNKIIQDILMANEQCNS